MDEKYIIKTVNVNGKEKINWVGIKTDNGIEIIELTNQDAIDIKGREDYYKRLYNIDDGQFFDDFIHHKNYVKTNKNIEELIQVQDNKSIEAINHKYYQLKLNCARTKFGWYDPDEYGFLKVYPGSSCYEDIGFFLKKLVIYYQYMHIIAEFVDDHFEDIILGFKINYDPNGVMAVSKQYAVDNPLSGCSDNLLKDELKKGITCFEYNEISDIEVGKFLHEFQKNEKNNLLQYKKEFDFVIQKQAIKDEIVARERKNAEKTKLENDALETLNNFRRTRKR